MKKVNGISITKASGKSEPFSIDKLKRSLGKAEANNDEIARVISEIRARLHEELYPITRLTLTKAEKQSLLEKKIVLCKKISENEQNLVQTGLNPTRIKKVLEEASQLSKHLIENGK